MKTSHSILRSLTFKSINGLTISYLINDKTNQNITSWSWRRKILGLNKFGPPKVQDQEKIKKQQRVASIDFRHH